MYLISVFHIKVWTCMWQFKFLLSITSTYFISGCRSPAPTPISIWFSYDSFEKMWSCVAWCHTAQKATWNLSQHTFPGTLVQNLVNVVVLWNWSKSTIMMHFPVYRLDITCTLWLCSFVITFQGLYILLMYLECLIILHFRHLLLIRKIWEKW